MRVEGMWNIGRCLFDKDLIVWAPPLYKHFYPDAEDVVTTRFIAIAYLEIFNAARNVANPEFEMISADFVESAFKEREKAHELVSAAYEKYKSKVQMDGEPLQMLMDLEELLIECMDIFQCAPRDKLIKRFKTDSLLEVTQTTTQAEAESFKILKDVTV